MVKIIRKAIKWILFYFRGTSRVCLYFSICDLMLDGYIYAYIVDDIDFRKYTYGYKINFEGGHVYEIKVIKVCCLTYY